MFGQSFSMLVCLFLAGQQTPDPPPSTQAAGTRLEIRVNAFVDMHYLVRKHVRGGLEMPDIEGFAEAAVMAGEVEAMLGGPPAWGFVEGTLGDCASVAEARRACAELPESFASRSGRTVRLRDAAMQLLSAYERIEAEFLRELWPRHRVAIERARRELEAALLLREERCFAFILEHLAMEDPRRPIPVYLVAEAPYPQGFSHRYRDGGVCFVGVEQLTGSLLCEIVIHEAIHALDIATLEQPTVLQTLRKRLLEGGFAPRSEAYRDVPHTVIFVQAAETVRRLIEPSHKHYGDVEGYYAKVPLAVKVVRMNWEAHLHGKISLARVIDQMIAATIAAYGDDK